jgi:hypothetical protein
MTFDVASDMHQEIAMTLGFAKDDWEEFTPSYGFVEDIQH